jgi:hypothetical protein
MILALFIFILNVKTEVLCYSNLKICGYEMVWYEKLCFISFEFFVFILLAVMRFELWALHCLANALLTEPHPCSLGLIVVVLTQCAKS